MARLFHFEFEVVLKSIRQLISIFAWTWAIFVFILSYFGRGEYNHINNNNENGPPPLFHSVFVPVLKVLVVAPSAFGYPQAGNHASAQSGQFNNDQQFSPYSTNSGQQQQQFNWGQMQQVQERNEGQLCAGCLPTSQQHSQSVFGSNLGGSGGNNYNQGFGYNTYDVKLTQPPNQWGQQNRQQDLATVQHMQINDDGQYSFSYNSADSSRQEERNLDGTVTGNYGYIDPTGKQVQVEYRASPNEGYHAFGNNIPQVNPASIQLPIPVQDTPEVQAARAQFFQAYDQQVKRIEQETAARNLLLNNQQQQNQDDNNNKDKKIEAIYSENNTPEGAKNVFASASDFKNLPEPIAVPDSNTLQHSEIEEDDELENDAVVISADDTENNNNNKAQAVAVKVPESLTRQGQQGQVQEPLYQISHVVGQNVNSGPGGQQGASVSQGLQRGEAFNNNNVQNQIGQSEPGQAQLPNYFYYVSVGGSPHYVTSNNLMRSDFPTSLKASLVGAIPLSAVHDAQVPSQSQQSNQVKTSPPVYLDFDKKQEGYNNNNNNYNNNMNNMNMNVQQQQQQQQQQNFVYGFIPGTIVSFGNNQNQQQNQQQVSNYNGQQQQQSISQSGFVGYPFFVFRK